MFYCMVSSDFVKHMVYVQYASLDVILSLLSLHPQLTHSVPQPLWPDVIHPGSFPIKSTLPVPFYSPVVTNIAFSVNLNRLTLKQTTHSDTGRKTRTHALPQTNAHAQPLKEKSNAY